MDSNRLQELLNRYWSGDSTVEEEQELRDHFRTAEVSEELRDTAALFRYFDESKKKSVTDITFDRVVVNKLSRPHGRGVFVNFFASASKIAAGLAVVIAATWFIRNEIRKTTPQEIVDTYDDPKLAFEETKKALMMISKGFGTAQQQASKINMFNEAKEEIEKEKKENL